MGTATDPWFDPPSSSPEKTNAKQPEIGTFSYYVVVDSGKTVLRGGKGLWARDVKSKLMDGCGTSRYVWVKLDFPQGVQARGKC